MRVSTTSDGFKVNAIAGTYVVLLGFDLPHDDCSGLLGFSLHRVDHTENEAYYLKASKTFSETDPGFPSGTLHSTRKHPIQSFQWADYSAKPGHHYTYTILALKGSPSQLTPYRQAVIDIHTESPESGDHDIYFNRGLAASQAYARRFGNVPPRDLLPNEGAYTWLSRGLNEALEDYIRNCEPGKHALRVAAYEFNYDAILLLIKQVWETGVDIKIVFDARRDTPKLENLAAIHAFGLEPICIARTQPKSYISHNKFIVKLEDGRPISVWTGGTNFSEGGIFGHSNVAHVIEKQDIASQYLEYWNALSSDPDSSDLKAEVERITPLPETALPPSGTTALFSPRKNLDCLDWYAQLAKNAQDGLFMTFAFGMNDTFKDVYENGQAPFRLALLEKIIRSMRAGPERDAELGRMQALRNKKENVFAVGGLISTSALDGWLMESLTGLNVHVRYVHNKFMLVDPLSHDPVIVAGSANFSDASIRRNDENMIVTRGNKRVADIYLGEFMRLYSHHAFRESLQWRDPDDPPKNLRTDDWWDDYFGNTSRSVRRQFFARDLG